MEYFIAVTSPPIINNAGNATFAPLGVNSTGGGSSEPTAVAMVDFDGDLDVDMSDFGRLQTCLGYDDIPALPPACVITDLANDGVIDVGDVNVFLGCLTGANIVGDPNCAD